MLLNELEKFGFTTKEAKIYLTLLELGTVTVSSIAKKSSINRSTSYVILDKLSKNGLVSISEKSGIKLYTAVSPDRLISIAEDSIKKYSELAQVAKKIQPELKSLYVGIGPKPKFQFFEGAEGLRTAYDDSLTSTETIRSFASVKNIHELILGYFPDYYQRRLLKKIKTRTIFPDTLHAKSRIRRDNEELRKSVLVSSKKYGFTPEINIYDNKVVFMSLIEKFAVIIESAEIADSLKKIFELSWSKVNKDDETDLI